MDTQNRIPADNPENRIAQLIRENVRLEWRTPCDAVLDEESVMEAVEAIAAKLRAALLDNVSEEIRPEVEYALELAQAPEPQ